MSETKKKKESLKEFFIRTFADPVLWYTVLIVMTIMYHYRNTASSVSEYGSTIAYGFLAVVIGWLMIRLMNFMSKHKILGSVCYMLVALAALQVFGLLIETGSRDYPISWGLWFFTPQDAMDYNKWFAASIFIAFMFFMISVVYYFTRIIYRIFMNFLIFIIPFAIYGKEDVKMPIGFIILMCVGYTMLMVNFRQLSNNEKVKIVDKPLAWRSASVFLILFTLVASLIPKPKVTADRTVLETLIKADAFTDKLVSMLNVFQETSSGNQFHGKPSKKPLYYVDAPYTLRMKTHTFTSYDFQNDQWSIGYLDKDFYDTTNKKPVFADNSGKLLEALAYAAKNDSDFCEKYGLEELADAKISSSKNVRVNIYSQTSGQYAPVPQDALSLDSSSYGGDIALTYSGLIYSNLSSFSESTSFSYSCSPESYYHENEKTAALLCRDDYLEIVRSAYESLLKMEQDEKTEEYERIVEKNIKGYHEAAYSLLDYGNDARIKALANEIVAGCKTDYEKAQAIEIYFYSNNYTYDLEYRKGEGENVDNFIFDSKTGVCYEYATAMTLLARAAGIPARYCEGFSVSDEISNQKGNMSFVVTAADAHGFPELYIRGFGWVTFEPTLTDALETVEKESTTNMLAKVGLILLAAAFVMFVFIIFRHDIAHRIFTSVNNRREPDEAVPYALRRTCQIYGIGKEKTSCEAAEIIKNTSGADIYTLSSLFDGVSYGDIKMTNNDKQKAMEIYNSAFEALKELRKQKRKKK